MSKTNSEQFKIGERVLVRVVATYPKSSYLYFFGNVVSIDPYVSSSEMHTPYSERYVIRLDNGTKYGGFAPSDLKHVGDVAQLFND